MTMLTGWAGREWNGALALSHVLPCAVAEFCPFTSLHSFISHPSAGRGPLSPTASAAPILLCFSVPFSLFNNPLIWLCFVNLSPSPAKGCYSLLSPPVTNLGHDDAL